MKIRKTLPAKGYTIIELMVTLTIFGIVALFAIPAFSRFIEKSRIKTEIIQAAGFLRSAQEIAISSNRTVYVFTAGLITYEDATSIQRSDYWIQDWIMAFKPIGKQYNSMGAQINEIFTSLHDDNRDYIIARQHIFTKSKNYVLAIIESQNHNNVLRNNLIVGTPTNDFSTTLEMEGYSKIRTKKDTPPPEAQGFFTGAPTFIAFYPSGEVSMPIFIVTERTELRERILHEVGLHGDTPFVYDAGFGTEIINGNYVSIPPQNGKPVNEWKNIRGSFTKPIAFLAGCRMGRSLTVDAIAYTFNPEIIEETDYIFTSYGIDTKTAFGIKNFIGTSPAYSAAPSFGNYLCGSKFLK